MNVFDLDEDDTATTLRAEDFQFPFQISNMVQKDEQVSVDHFFRLTTNANAHPKDVSMRKNRWNAKRTINGDIDRSKVIKCEKYYIIGSFQYHSRYIHEPFDEVFAFIKIATDRRPGTELIRLIFDDEDSSYESFSRWIRDYFPTGSPVPIDITMSNNMNKMTSDNHIYPRAYIFQRFSHNSYESVAKFYILPAIMPVLLFFPSAEDKDNLVEILSLASALVLADVALLFVNKSPTMTFNEQSLLFQLCWLIIASLISAYFLKNDLSEDSRYSMASFIFLGIILTVVFVYVHSKFARKYYNAFAKNLEEENFDAICNLL